MRIHRACFLVIFLALALSAAAEQPRVVTLDSPAPLLQIKVMVKAGAAADPQGLEGLAYLTGRLLIEGGFGDPKTPVTKDKLAEMVRPWGSGAYPDVNVSKETTTFSMTVPKEALEAYVKQVLGSLFAQPLFAPAELDRVRAETLQVLRSALRLERMEMLGLVALDNYVHAGTSFAHPDIGTEKGLEQATADAVRGFYATYYRPENVVVGISSADAAVVEKVVAALSGIGKSDAARVTPRAAQAPPAVSGREVVIIAMPNAISTGIHAGFPLPVTRAHKDYWPLYVANVWFGTHRDSFSHLYQVIREERGYNYGDYSYIEHFEDRPWHLFPPTNSPRSQQYFSIWIRPVAHNYATHIMKALTWELEKFVREGLSEEECALSKNKARVLYLSLAENAERLLGYRLDDDFYALRPGYLESYLVKIAGVSCGEVNAAIKKYLQVKNIKYVLVTDDEAAPKIAEEIASNRAVWGKPPGDYQIDSREQEGQKVWTVPSRKLELLQRDAVWAGYWLDIPRERIRVVPATQMFATPTLPQ